MGQGGEDGVVAVLVGFVGGVDCLADGGGVEVGCEGGGVGGGAAVVVDVVGGEAMENIVVSCHSWGDWKG